MRTPEEIALADVSACREAREWVGHLYGMPTALVLETLRAPGRTRPLPQARAELSRFLRHQGWTVTRIGRLLNRDHSTVCHYLNHMPA